VFLEVEVARVSIVFLLVLYVVIVILEVAVFLDVDVAKVVL
tara:strand:+ start:342 stop:464 length:123 start_codon:yes stop_codon:yes gene_type:complete